MAPSTRKTTEANSDPVRRIMTRSIYKKQQQQQQKVKIQSFEEVSSTTTTTAMEDCVINSMDSSSNKEICSTPKGDKYMIPKISTCPPAPKKKKRLMLNNCMSSSSAAKFFAHSDLELFFLMTPRDIHA